MTGMSFAQSTLDRPQKFFTRNKYINMIVQDSKNKKYGPALSTRFDGYHLNEIEVRLFDTPFTVKYLSRIVSNQSKTLILHPGFTAMIENGNIGKWAIDFKKNFPDKNIIIIEGLSNYDFSKRNCFFSIGGLHETGLIYEILKHHWKSQSKAGDLNKDSIIIGSSSSAYSVLSTPIYINSLEASHPIIGSILFSGYDTMEPFYKGFKNGQVIDGHQLFNNLLLKIGYNKMNTDRAIFDDQTYLRCQLKRPLYKRDASFVDLIEQTYIDHLELHQKIFNQIYLNQNLKAEFPKTYEDYVKTISLRSLVPAVGTPFKWVQSKNDLFPNRNHYSRFMEKAQGNSLITGENPEYGSHMSYNTVYQSDWVIQKIIQFNNSLTN